MVKGLDRLDYGLAGVSRWRIDDETHLPAAPRLAPAYAPAEPRLSEILRRPSLDERLPDMLRPESVTPDLMQPSVMSATRVSVAAQLRLAARTGRGEGAEAAATLSEAAELLEAGIVLDEEIRAALAALLRG